ncbi:MAG: hypothetical protein ACJAUH_003316 [Saprospiraceae bacterium]|jgi:hypothetical protein|tara:strand:- start:1809 stop:2417 length:609 start_codon:yes stop_codon:yes gene_type:complete
MTETKVITKQTIAQSMDYEQYRTFISERLENNQSTGTNHSEGIVGYTSLNEKRMKRLDKTTKLTEETTAAVSKIDKPVTWLVITEGWCGDAAQSIPVIAKMAAQNPNVDLKLILRDEHLEIMDAFLTNGGRAIPKIVALDTETLDVLGSWGPRPVEAHEMFWKAKNSPDFNYPEIQKELQLWYAKDKTLNTQKELVDLIEMV